jgi:hypothetical protein
MINFKLDSEEKKISVEMKLKGEVDVIYFEIGRYEIFKEDEKLFIEISEFNTNREWMNVAIGNFLSAKKIEIPMKYEKVLQIAL